MALLFVSWSSHARRKRQQLQKIPRWKRSVPRLRASMVDANSAPSLRMVGGVSFTVSSKLLRAIWRITLMVVVSPRPTATPRKHSWRKTRRANVYIVVPR